MSSIDVAKICRNIYGTDSASLHEESLLDFKVPGYADIVHPEPKLFYVGGAPIQPTKTEIDYRNIPVRGGNKMDILEDARPTPYSSIEAYADADSEFAEWIATFNVHYWASNPRPNAIWVYPGGAEQKKIISAFKKELSERNIEPGSLEVGRHVASTDCAIKHYILDIFESDTRNNGKPYDIPRDFPNTTSNEVLRRMNRLDEIYWVTLDNANKVSVGTSESMSGAVKLEVMAVCSTPSGTKSLVLKGKLPDAKETSHRNVVNTNSLRGGSRSRNDVDYFKKLMRLHNNDIDASAYHYIGALALSAGGSKEVIKKIAKHYSGDFVHSAFELMFDSDITSNPLLQIYEDSNVDDVHDQLVEAYSPKAARVSIQKAVPVLSRCYSNAKLQAKTGKEANALFMKSIKAIYSKIKQTPMLKADIATGYIRNNSQSVQTFEDAVDLVEGLSLFETDNSSGFNTTLGFHAFADEENDISAPLMNSVYFALSSSPFTGDRAHSSVPLLARKPKRRMVRKVSEEESQDNLDVSAFLNKPKVSVRKAEENPQDSDLSIDAYLNKPKVSVKKASEEEDDMVNMFA